MLRLLVCSVIKFIWGLDNSNNSSLTIKIIHIFSSSSSYSLVVTFYDLICLHMGKDSSELNKSYVLLSFEAAFCKFSRPVSDKIKLRISEQNLIYVWFKCIFKGQSSNSLNSRLFLLIFTYKLTISIRFKKNYYLQFLSKFYVLY